MGQENQGKLIDFGPWDDPAWTIAKYVAQRDDLQAGRKPQDTAEGVTVREVANRFLTAQRHLIDSRELSPRTVADYRSTCLRVAAAFGKARAVSDLRPDDFEALRAAFARGQGTLSLGDQVRRTRSLFKYAHDAGLIDSPLRFGPTFKNPGKRAIRQACHASGLRLFEVAELRRAIDAATTPLRAIILLGINAGFGNSNCAGLPR